MIDCPQCKQILTPTSKFCCWCGARIPLSDIFKQKMADEETKDRLKESFYRYSGIEPGKFDINPEPPPCTEGYHKAIAKGQNLLIGVLDEDNLFPESIKYCDQCGKELLP